MNQTNKKKKSNSKLSFQLWPVTSGHQRLFNYIDEHIYEHSLISWRKYVWVLLMGVSTAANNDIAKICDKKKIIIIINNKWRLLNPDLVVYFSLIIKLATIFGFTTSAHPNLYVQWFTDVHLLSANLFITKCCSIFLKQLPIKHFVLRSAGGLSSLLIAQLPRISN